MPRLCYGPISMTINSFQIGDEVRLKEISYPTYWGAAFDLYTGRTYTVTDVEGYEIYVKTSLTNTQAIATWRVERANPDPFASLLCNCKKTYTFKPSCLNCIPKFYP